MQDATGEKERRTRSTKTAGDKMLQEELYSTH
jgi:hypothetical protein